MKNAGVYFLNKYLLSNAMLYCTDKSTVCYVCCRVKKNMFELGKNMSETL